MTSADQPDLETPRPRRRFGRVALGLSLGGVAVAAIAAGLAMSGGDREQNPEAVLGDIRRFVADATSAHFTGTLVERSESDGETEEFRSELDGDLAPGDGGLRWRLDEDGWTREAIVAGTHFYQRGWPAEAGGSANTPWEYFSANSARAQRVIGFSEPTFLRDVQAVAPLVSWLTPGELGGLLDLLQRPERMDDDTIRASLGLSDILGDFTGAAGLRDLVGGVDIELTSGPDGRLDHMRWVVDLAARADSDLVQDDRSHGPFEDYTLDARVRFSGWGKPVDIEAPPRGMVDATPHVDEDGITQADFLQIVAPRSLPDGFHLFSASVLTPDAAQDTDECPYVHLSWGHIDAAPVYGAEGTEPPPSLDFELTPAGCTVEPEEDAVVVDLGDTQLVVRSRLPDEFIDAAVSDLVPFNLAAQPVFREKPPAASS